MNFKMRGTHQLLLLAISVAWAVANTTDAECTGARRYECPKNRPICSNGKCIRACFPCTDLNRSDGATNCAAGWTDCGACLAGFSVKSVVGQALQECNKDTPTPKPDAVWSGWNIWMWTFLWNLVIIVVVVIASVVGGIFCVVKRVCRLQHRWNVGREEERNGNGDFDTELPLVDYKRDTVKALGAEELSPVLRRHGYKRCYPRIRSTPWALAG